MRFARAAPLLIIFLVIGCTTTKTETVRAGLFQNDPEKMLEAYERVKPFETNLDQLKRDGWDFSAPNIEQLPGDDALREILGEEAFQGILKDFLQSGEKLEEFFKILNPYSMVRVRYREIVTTTDRFYLNTKETIRVGRSMVLTFVFRDDLVVYRPKPRDVRINERTEDYAILQGLLEIVEKYGGFGENIRDAIEKIREILDKRKD